MDQIVKKRTSAERLVDDYEELFEPLTSRFCEALLAAAGGTGPQDRVIDVAAGTGALSVPVARTGASLLACDIMPEAVRRLSERLRPFAWADARRLDGEALDVPSESFDAAFSAFGVMLFPDFRRGLRELVRVVRPGGRIGIAVWTRPEGGPASTPFRAAYMSAFPDRPAPPLIPGVAVLSDPASLSNELELAGCSGVSVELARADWPVRRREWLGKNVDRLFQVNPLWDALDRGDRERLSGALSTEVARLGSRVTSARAWLAVGRKAS